MATQQIKYPRPSKAWSNNTLSMARFNPLRAVNRIRNKGLTPRHLIWLQRSFRTRRASARSTPSSHPGASVAAREICGNEKRCLGQPDSTNAYSPSIPGYMTRCSPYIRALPLMAWHEENICPPTGKVGNIFKRNLRRHGSERHVRQSDGWQSLL